ncbi:hypothetical protein AJ79_07930 [Helicocarpus griseus UAMH5409]|uniref:Uncharacterized protein n=1 Tax=Helicocarpus griseus UAMH5409 TaxID=1447875 RepID=A0A2B7WXR6_9EURO|nr:hypothetical protein AJ79_07930 [Helicocarpus griseus UAMH5409]
MSSPSRSSSQDEGPQDVLRDPRFQTVSDNVKNEFPGEEPEEHGKKPRPQRAPTAHKGSEGGSSAAKRIRQTELREKARSKGRSEK